MTYGLPSQRATQASVCPLVHPSIQPPGPTQGSACWGTLGLKLRRGASPSSCLFLPAGPNRGSVVAPMPAHEAVALPPQAAMIVSMGRAHGQA